jgi:hypothetical protein
VASPSGSCQRSCWSTVAARGPRERHRQQGSDSHPLERRRCGRRCCAGTRRTARTMRRQTGARAWRGAEVSVRDGGRVSSIRQTARSPYPYPTRRDRPIRADTGLLHSHRWKEVPSACARSCWPRRQWTVRHPLYFVSVKPSGTSKLMPPPSRSVFRPMRPCDQPDPQILGGQNIMSILDVVM